MPASPSCCPRHPHPPPRRRWPWHLTRVPSQDRHGMCYRLERKRGTACDVGHPPVRQQGINTDRKLQQAKLVRRGTAQGGSRCDRAGHAGAARGCDAPRVQQLLDCRAVPREKSMHMPWHVRHSWVHSGRQRVPPQRCFRYAHVHLHGKLDTQPAVRAQSACPRSHRVTQPACWH